MDFDAAAFVLDRVDVAREAIMEAQQIVGKFSQPEDAEIARLLQDMLDRVEQLDATVRSGSYPS
ncbi:MAG: hypothetical protein ACYC66_00925 [Chloroflexota bacterium]